jgi:hypothetical protein
MNAKYGAIFGQQALGHCTISNISSQNMLWDWRIQRGVPGVGTPPFVRKFCKNRVKITQFESGTPFENPK